MDVKPDKFNKSFHSEKKRILELLAKCYFDSLETVSNQNKSSSLVLYILGKDPESSKIAPHVNYKVDGRSIKLELDIPKLLINLEEGVKNGIQGGEPTEYDWDEKTYKVRFVQLLFTYTLLFYCETGKEALEEIQAKDKITERWEDETENLRTRLYSYLYLMLPVVKSYKKIREANKGKRNAILQAQIKAITSSIYIRYKYIFSLSANFPEVDTLFRCNDRTRRANTTYGCFFFPYIQKRERKIGMVSVEQSIKSHKLFTFSASRLVKSVNDQISHILFREPKPVIEPEYKIDNTFTSQIDDNAFYSDFYFWNGAGMTIPSNAKISLAFNRLYPTVQIRDLNNSKHLNYEENSWNVVLFASNKFISLIDPDKKNPSTETSGVADQAIKAYTVPEESTMERYQAVSNGKDFALANFRFDQLINPNGLDIHIRLPYLSPKADILSQIEYVDETDPDSGIPGIVLTSC